MSRRLLVLTALLALVIGVLAPVAASAAQIDPIAPVPPDEQVEVSTTGSYIVVMEADPLIVDYDAEDLDTAPAVADAAEMVESHDEALEDVGADTGDKVQDFTNALNGFSALISHDEAVALAANKSVRLV